MKCSHVADEEGFQAKLFKFGASVLGPYLSILFNRVIHTRFSSSWSRPLIFPIHKTDPVSDPGNYRTIMIGHTFAKLYVTTLNAMLSVELNRIGCRARGQASFQADYQTMDHSFTLWAIIEKARHKSEKVYCCFVDFRKAFDSIPRVALLERLREIGISEMLRIGIMRLYETVVGRFWTPEGFSDPIHSTIGVKQGCPLSPTLFGLYIDELEDFLLKSSLPGDGFYLHQVLISILLFADDVVLLASSPDRLQRLLHGLALFCDQRQLVVNLGKTRIMVFNCLKTSHLHFMFQGQEIEITSSYTYLGVMFSGPQFNMRPAIQPKVNKGMGSLAFLEKQCFKHHFQDTSSKLSLLDALVWPTVLYGFVVWGPSLLSSDWASIEQVQTLFLRHIIRCHKFTPHSVIFAEFGVHPFRLAAIFYLVLFLHRLRGFADAIGDRNRYSYLAYCSSVSIADVESGSRARFLVCTSFFFVEFDWD